MLHSLLSVALLLALPPGGTFIDDNSSVHEGSIEAIAAAGITRGCNPPANDKFCPSRPVSRAQMAAFLTRALNLASTPTDHFTDDDGSIFEGDINAVAAAGITRGCNPPANDTFCPSRSISRAEMASMLARAFAYPASTTDWFTDDDASIHEAAINSIAAAGVTRGCDPPTNTSFCPDDPVTRGQMASFLVRALGLPPIIPPEIPNDYVTPGDVGDSVGVGVVAPVPTTVVGSQRITADGTLLENVIVDGCVTVEADDVTIRNVIINCAGYYPIKANESELRTGLNIHHSQINGLIDAKLFLFNNITDVRIADNELIGGDDTVFADGNLDGFVFTRNFRHDPLGDESSHLDGFQLGEFGVTTGEMEISYNYFDEIPDNIGVTDLVFATNFAEVHVDVTGNYIAEHGWYTLRAYNTATLDVRNNTIEAGVNRVALLNSPGPHHFACNFFTDGSPVTSADVAGGTGVTFGNCE
ncbi:MAG: S-layer homology domain-containing protein [Acidimicrobiia bacterium]|nr:S-layer homology domain-containing protein [Acidimicrobiia bacterium]